MCRDHFGRASRRTIFRSKNTAKKQAKRKSATNNCWRNTPRCLRFTWHAWGRLPVLPAGSSGSRRRFSFFDLALLGVATHKLSRLVAKDRITGIIRAPFVNYIRSAGAGEVEEEPRGRGIQRGIGNLVSCPYCMGPWSATALAFGFLFAPRISRFFAGILSSVAVSDFLHRAYVAAKGNS